MERIEFVRSRAKNAGMLLAAIALAGGSLFMAVSSDETFERTIGWAGTLFFGLALLAGIRNIVRGGTVFAFDANGITDHANSIVIPWSEIEECAIVSVRGAKFLALTLRNPDQFLSRVSATQQKLARVNERMGWGHWTLSFAGISPGLDTALKFIRENASAVRVAGE